MDEKKRKTLRLSGLIGFAFFISIGFTGPVITEAYPFQGIIEIPVNLLLKIIDIVKPAVSIDQNLQPLSIIENNVSTLENNTVAKNDTELFKENIVSAPKEQLPIVSNETVVKIPANLNITFTGVSPSDLTANLLALEARLKTEVSNLYQQQNTRQSASMQSVYQVVSHSNRIDQLTNTSINTPTITGGSMSNASFSGSVDASTIVSSGDATFDTDTLYVDSADNRVGVGTSSPTDTLSINGPVYLADATPSETQNRLYSSSGSLYWSGSAVGGGADSWTTSSGNVYRGTGNVGIGTTSPYAKLSVVGQTVSEYFTATSTTISSTFPYASTTALTVSGAGGLQLASGLTGPLQAIAGLVSATSTLSIGYGGTGLQTAPAYGEVLLGNSAGGYTLTSTTSLGITSGWDALSDISLTKGYFVVGNDAGLAQATSSLFVSSVGFLGLGTTSPYAKLSVSGTSLDTSPLLAISTSTASATSTAFIIDGNGKIGVGTGVPTETLDIIGSLKFDTLNAGVISLTASSTGKTTYYRASADTDTARGVALQSAFTASVAGDTIVIGPGNYLLTAELAVKESMYVKLQGSTLYHADYSIDIFETTGDYWRIMGPGVLRGAGMAVGSSANEAGIRTTGSTSANWTIDGLHFTGFRNAGIHTQSSHGSRHIGGAINNVTTWDNYIGLYQDTAEYLRVSNSQFASSTYGIYGNMSNINASSVNITDNSTGIYMTNSGNHGHGVFSACKINHNNVGSARSMYVDQLTYGMNFVGCQITDGTIYLNATYGINFVDGWGNLVITMNGTFTGYNTIRNWRFSAEPTISATAEQRKYLKIEQSVTTTSDTSTSVNGISPKHGGTGNTAVFTEGSVPFILGGEGLYTYSPLFKRDPGNLLTHTGVTNITNWGGETLINTGFHGNRGLIIRGSSDAQPASTSPDAVSGIFYWFKADALSLSDGDSVTTWTDSSGGGRNATQSTAANKPVFKTGVLNGKPVVRFDGSNDYLDSASASISQPMTIFMVSRADVVKSQIRFTLKTGNVYHYNDTTTTATLYAGTTGQTFTTDVTKWNLWDHSLNGASSDAVVNGGTATSISPGTANSTGGIRIGDHPSGSFAFDGDIAEIIIYSGTLSTSDREKVRRYLTEKYGLYIANGTSEAFTQQTGNLQEWQNASSSVLSVVDSTGKFGIGTSSPYSKLSVWGTSNGTNRLFELTNSASTTLLSFLEDGTGYFLGNIGISTTSPSSRLSITQSANTAGGGLWLAETGDTDFRSAFMDTSGVMSFYGGDTAGTLNTATLNAAGAWTNASDISYKENIIDLNSKYNLGTILSMKPRYYKMKGMEMNQIGFIAQELETFVPEVVEGVNGSKGISYGNLTALTVSAIQDLSNILNIASATDGKFSSIRLESLENRLTALESRGIQNNISSLSFDSVLESLKNLGIKIANGMVEFGKIIARSITIGSASSPSGISLFSPNGSAYCLTISDDGNPKSTPGECPNIISNSQPVEELSSDISSTTESKVGGLNIILLGNNPAEVPLNSTYIDFGAIASTTDGTTLMPDIIENTVDTSKVGQYKVTWGAHDSLMNLASSTRIINVFDPYPISKATTTLEIIMPVATTTPDIIPISTTTPPVATSTIDIAIVLEVSTSTSSSTTTTEKTD